MKYMQKHLLLSLLSIFLLLSNLHAADIIIDNGDPGTSFTGTWQVSAAVGPWDPADGNATSLWSRSGGTYTWHANLPESGIYNVYMWHTYYPSRSTNAPVTITYNGGSVTVPVNQKQNAGTWYYLTTQNFNAAAGGTVKITAKDPYPTTYCADAVKFVFDSNGEPPACLLNAKFNTATLTQGMYYYTDRTYTLTSVPAQYSGLPMIKTPNSELGLTNSSGYMTFELTSPATVYVAYDSRGAGSLPAWMNGFTYTGNDIQTSLSTQPSLRVYSREFAAGCTDLGANKASPATGYYSNYIVFYDDGPVTYDFYCDDDGDGYIDMQSDGSCTGIGCQPAGCQVAPGNDCNDLGGNVNPGVAEICDDGIDNDCDGSTDSEDLDCEVPPTCLLDAKFNTATLTQGSRYYTDRTYTLTSVPAQYSGLPMIKTPNSELGLTNSSGYMTFELTSPTTVYIAYDSRGAGSLPAWMSGFTYTGNDIQTSLSTQPSLRVYSREFAAGCVDLGANKASPATGYYSNYIVFYDDGPVTYDFHCDDDGDGYIDMQSDGSCTGIGCEPAGCQVAPGNDCNDLPDEGGNINPGAAEVCDDGIDNDCDGSTDSEDLDCEVPPTCLLDAKFKMATLTQGSRYYTDRTYTLTSVPAQYSGLPMIKTPNSELGLTNSSGYMTFELTSPTTVYIAYDSRGAGSLPAWMSGFTYTGNDIQTSLSTQPSLRVYSREFAAGCVDLGANMASPATGYYSNYIVFYDDHIFVAIGDSITYGRIDDYPADDTSQDGRNTGGGYEPILNDLLTASESGIPHNIINAGVSGATSANGLASISTTLARYPYAQRYLVMYGTNDARPGLTVPSGLGKHPVDPGYAGTYKDNMQRIINAINNAGKEVCLAKPPIALGDDNTPPPYPDPDTGARNVLIKEYNAVIDELVSDPLNNITVTPPDFYNYFKAVDPVTGTPRYEDQYSDNIHPNGRGFISMAELWLNALAP